MNAILKSHPGALSANRAALSILNMYEKAASFVAAYVAAAEQEMKAQRAISDLYGMSDRELRDIGITRGEIEHAVRGAAQ